MKSILPVFFLFASSLFAVAQKSLPYSPDKFRINLFDTWGKSHPVMLKLVEKLPQICPELKDKDICGDQCNPAYTVDFYLSDPFIEGYFPQKIVRPANTNTRNLVRIPVSRNNMFDHQPEYIQTANPNENWAIYTEFSFQGYLLLRDKNKKIVTRLVLVDTNEVWETVHATEINLGPDLRYKLPNDYIDDHKDELVPTKFEMLAIVERKIMQL